MRYGGWLLGGCALLALLTGPARAAPLASYLARAELAPLAQPAAALPFRFGVQPGEDATLELLLDDDAAAFTESEPRRYLLRVLPKDASHRVEVRQRAVVYMNIGDEGPHVAIPAARQRGAWRPAVRRGPGAFEVGNLPAPSLRLTRAQLLAAVQRSEVGRDERWLAIARRCTAPDQGPCYTVTDDEYEVTISKQGRMLARGVLRLRQPNGC